MAEQRTVSVGDHVLQFGDSGPDWCHKCGTFSCYLRLADGTPTQCTGTTDNWWDDGNQAQPDSAEDLKVREFPKDRC